MALLQLQERCSLLQISSSQLPNPLKPPEILARTNFCRQMQPRSPSSSKIPTPHTPAVPKATILARKAAAPWRGELLLPLAVASWPLPSLSAAADGKVSLESIVVDIDDFNNRNPFFVAGVVFVWLVVIPLVQEYFKKYKAVGAIDAFRKIRDVPEAQLLDIRRGKSVRFMAPPNLRLVGKSAVQVDFDVEDKEGFVREVKSRFPDPANTVVCVLDNGLATVQQWFQGSLCNQRGGLRGPEGWQAIQENYLPPLVHVFPRKKKSKKSAYTDVSTNGTDDQQEGLTSPSSSEVNTINGIEDGHENPNGSISAMKPASSRPLSPYPNYHDMKPPSSPTPSKPER